MKNIKNLTIVLFVAAFFAVSCGDSSSSKSDKTETSESKSEKSEVTSKSEESEVTSKSERSAFNSEVKIGDQIWMTKNLNVDKFQNGDPIPHVESAEAWKQAGKNKQPAYCYYDNDPSNGEKYGKLYNWYAVNDPRGLAPAGWHIPSDEEWTTLTDYLGGEDVAGTKMKSTSGWDHGGNGTNESDFSGLPGGNRISGGKFTGIGNDGDCWSSTEAHANIAWGRFLDRSYNSIERLGNYKGGGLSVRCVKN